MSGKAEMKIIVLFPSELREIARLLGAYRECKDEKARIKAMQKLLMKVEQSFFHLTKDPDAYFTLASEPSVFETAEFEEEKP